MLYQEGRLMGKKTAMSEQTRKKLKEAFLELCEKNGISNVTVGAVTKKAGYNRCTFYNYYDDLRSMLDEIEDTVIEQIRLKMPEIFSNGIPEDISTVFPLLLSVFEEYGNTLYILLGRNGDAAFRERLRKTVKEFFREMFKGHINPERLEYMLTYVVSAGLGLIEHWYETGKEYSTEDFFKLTQSLLANGILEQLKSEANNP